MHTVCILSTIYEVSNYMRGEWIDIDARRYDPATGAIKARGFFPLGRLGKESGAYGIHQHYQLMQLADFVYNPSTCAIIKNRAGTIENLYNAASKYISLQNHPNPQIRKMLEKVETMALLAE
jgi:hypothetical protein